MSRVAHDGDVPLTSPVPAHRAGVAADGGTGRLRGFGPTRTRDARPTLPGVGRWRVGPVGVGVAFAHPRQPRGMATAKPRDRVSAEARIPGESDAPAGDSDHHQADESAQNLGGGSVKSVAFAVVVLGSVAIDQDGQSPGTGGEGERHPDGENDPRVAVTPGGVAVGRADGIAMASRAGHAASGVAIHGVISDPSDRFVLRESGHDEASEETAEWVARPLGARANPSLGRGVTGREVPQGAEDPGDSATSGRQTSCGQQGLEASGGGRGDRSGKRGQQRGRLPVVESWWCPRRLAQVPQQHHSTARDVTNRHQPS